MNRPFLNIQMATAQKERTIAPKKKPAPRTNIGAMQLEQGPASRSIAHYIPERWRDPVAVLLIFLSLIFFFRGVLDSSHTFSAGDNVASDSFKPFLDAAKAQGDDMPQWIPNIFTGMPAFAALVVTGERSYDLLHEIFDVVQSVPRALSPNEDAMTHIWHYFILGLGMYLLLRVTRNTSRLVAFFGAFSAIFSTWIITYVMIGHNTKIFAIMTMPYIFMAIEKLRTPKMRWQSVVFWCAVLATAFHFLLESTHAQMEFYIFLAVLIYFVVSLVIDLVRKHHEFTRGHLVGQLARSGVLALLMAGLAFSMSADRYLSTLAYEPYSIRGTPPIKDVNTPENAATAAHATTASGGLDWNYATAWSFSPSEVITFIIPAWYGFGKLPYDAPDVPPDSRIQTYWGQMGGTDAANYTGIVVLLLGIIGIFTLWKRDRLVAPLAIISLFALLLSFGGNWPILFRPMFNLFPMFNKFRAPMMALVLMQLSFPILAALTLEEILRVWKLRNPTEDARLLKYFKRALYVTGAFLLIAVLGRGAITSSVHDGIQKSRLASYPDAVKDYIASVAANDALICALLAAIAVVMAFYFLKRKISPLAFGAGILILTVIDLWRVDTRPMEIITRDQYESNFQQHDYIQFIKQDKSLYRVTDLTEQNPSNVLVSFGMQTAGGYHAAKMREFQDVVDITGNENGNGIFNPFMYNLLNTKYILANGALTEDRSRFVPVFQSREPAPADQSGKAGQPTIVWENPQVLPRVFLAQRYEVKPKLDILHAMHDGSFNPRDVVYLEDQPKNAPALYAQTIDTMNEAVTMESYKNEEVDFRTHTSGPRLVFMSDAWYPDWTATVDGKETPIYRADYSFRAIVVPQGGHEVKFTYNDPHYVTGRSISLTTNILALIGLAIGFSSLYYVRKRKLPEVEIVPSKA
jgi:hypothetical protein